MLEDDSLSNHTGFRTVSASFRDSTTSLSTVEAGNVIQLRGNDASGQANPRASPQLASVDGGSQRFGDENLSAVNSPDTIPGIDCISNRGPDTPALAYVQSAVGTPWSQGSSTVQPSADDQSFIRASKLAENHISLLSCYRDRISTMMDLGLNDSVWGVDILLQSTQITTIYNAILSLANTYQLRTSSTPGYLTSLSPKPFAHSQAIPDDETSEGILHMVEVVLIEPPRNWLAEFQRYGFECVSYLESDKRKPLWLRLILAAILAAPSNLLSNAFSLSPSLQESPTRQRHDTIAYGLRIALHLLSRSLTFVHNIFQKISQPMPLASAWTSCWSEVQIWYALRLEEMQPMLELASEEDHDEKESDTTPLSAPATSALPYIAFSNAASVVANAVHHLTAILLLQHKPRHIKPTAEPASSTSASWHAMRITAISAAAVEHDVWDPLLTTAVIRAAQILSHPAQIRAMSGILKAMSRQSGMCLDHEILSLDDTVTSDFVSAF